MNGKPGDHPISDILVHGLEVFGQEADDLIRQISRLCSQRELYQWWDERVAASSEREVVLREATARRDALLQRAQSHGWETGNES